MNQKILIYGFGPFNQYPINVTEQAVKLIVPSKQLATKVFITQFDRQMIENELELQTPDIIIGLGQTSKARKYRIERKAVNQYKDKHGRIQKINAKGQSHLHSNLKLPKCTQSTITYDAGTYVCNFSMYVCLEYCKVQHSQFAFIHVPITAQPKDIANYVQGLIPQITESS